jgi:5-formyltetrahydrofolate cyclo-ligase
MSTDVAAAKKAMRALMHRKRADMDACWRDVASACATQRIAELPEFAAARCVSCYLALPQEVQTEHLIGDCRRHGKQVCVPVWDESRGLYGWALWRDGEPVRTGKLGVTEPAAPAWVAPEAIDLMVAPGVAFDAQGGRLGHGGGYYDRLMRALRPDAPRAGLAFGYQLVPLVPQTENDVTVDFVVTETNIIRTREGAG